MHRRWECGTTYGGVFVSAEHFGRRLRELREAARLTQEQLAEKVGVKRDAVVRWESSKREPVWSSVLALAAALGVSCEAFAEPPAQPPPPPRRGRPPKPQDEAAPEQPKRPRGQPKKGGKLKEKGE